MKPIIMSTEDVRALLDGRKTMIRRVIKPRHGGDLEVHSDIAGTPRLSERCGDRCRGLIPPYEVGDALYVREAWRVGAWNDEGSICVDYKADGFARREWLKISDCDLYEELWQQSSDDAREASASIGEDGNYTWLPGQSPTRWRSPVTMPREAARLFLRVKDVRVERVQDITVDDAGREGFEGFHHKNPMLGNLPEIVWNFKNEWDARNAKRGYGWDSNPWTWVIEFEKCDPE